MKVSLLYILGLFLLMLLFSTNVRAQAYRFIYIQAENKQPFYVKMDKKILNSSASGYIIISKLIDSTYNFTIGFPENERQEYELLLEANNTNAGLLLKKSGANVWDLYDLQTFKPVSLKKLEPVAKKDTMVLIDNEFARILAEVVNDPSIAQIAINKQSEFIIKANQAGDSKTSEIQKDTLPPVKKIETEESKTSKSEIIKLDQEITTEGLRSTYIDITKVPTDTVKVFMPVKKEDTVVYDKETKIANPVPPAKNTEANKIQMINSDCKQIATLEDFLQLQKKMTEEKNEKNILKIANKQLLKTCFTCEQIKILSDLFSLEEERYKFFVAAYPFVSDTHNFGILEDRLTDNYYKIRFKAMLTNK